MHRPEETRSERMLHFELRNGPMIRNKLVDKVQGQWVELARRNERIIHQSLGEKLDAERRRKHDVILQILYDEAQQGKVFTSTQFSERFENKAGLGGRDSIQKRLAVLATKGYLKYFRDYEEYELPAAPRSKFGFMCVEEMELKLDK